MKLTLTHKNWKLLLGLILWSVVAGFGVIGCGDGDEETRLSTSLPGGGSEMRYIPELDVYIGAVTNTDRDILSDAPILTERVKQALLNER